MANTGSIIASVLIVVGLLMGIIGAVLMFYVVPNSIEDATFPEDFDDHYTYGGYMTKLDMTTGGEETIDFTVDRHIAVDEVLDGGELRIEERITGRINGTDPYEFVPELDKHNTYEVDAKDLVISYVTNNEGYEMNYTEDDDVNWIFPHPVDKDKDFRIWNMNIMDYSDAVYLGKETRGGIECYVFRGEETMYEVPLSAEQAALLPPGSTMKLTLWEKAWVHPLTGTIVDYAKEIKQYLYFPELPEVPEIKYPSDLLSTTGFDGSVVMFDQSTGLFNSFEGITAVRTIAVVNATGYDLKANETVEVALADGTPMPMLSSAVQVIFNASTGANVGMGRTGQYLFPPTGVAMANYSVWDDGFGAELTAHYIGYDNVSFAPLQAYIYNIYIENQTYLPGGYSTLDMTYYVEPQTGIVLDVEKHLTNWRPQNARRLPLDTAIVNKTVHLNTTINTLDPMTGATSSMEIVAEQVINCTGYTDATFAVAKFQETVTKYLPSGTPMGPPAVAKFGVDAVTMGYADAPGWSDTTRTGVFTFPIGTWNETGQVSPYYVLYNSDLMTSRPAMLTTQYELGGLQAAEYTMKESGIPLTWDAVSATLGKTVNIPGGSAAYACNFTYVVDINTGTILDIDRVMNITLYPPTYEWLYQNMDSTSYLKGAIAGTNVTMEQHVVGADLVPEMAGMALINITTRTLLDNGTDFLPPSMVEFPLNITSHEVLNETLQPTGTYWLFPANPTAAPTYPMMMKLAGNTLLGAAMVKSSTAVNATYVWTNLTKLPGAMVNPAISEELNTTLTYTWLVDIQTGAVLDTTVNMDFELPASLGGGYSNNTFAATGETKMGWAVVNKMIGWALSKKPVAVLEAEATLAVDEAAAAAMKAQYMAQLLLIADGVEPALDLSMAFNATTKATMKATATATKAQLAQLPLLIQAHAIDDLLKSKGNLVAFVYYKQVDENVDENKGSVAYWADFAKGKEDKAILMGTTIPIILYLMAGALIIVGIALILRAGKTEEELPEPEEGGEGVEGERGEDEGSEDKEGSEE